MDPLTRKLQGSPLLARVLPFVIFLVLTFCQGMFGEASRYWFYLAKTVTGAWMIWSIRPFVTEMRWALSWEAVAAGVTVFVLWIGLEGLYPKLGKDGPHWNPNTQFGEGSAMAWFFIAVRVLGSSLVVPPLEEVFYRSFLYRYVVNPNFESVPIGKFHLVAFLATSALFAVEHREWLPGLLCGFVFQALVLRKKRLGDAITAHAIANLLLGIWMVWKNAWQY